MVRFSISALSLFLFSILLNPAVAQEKYSVIAVKGSISLKKSGTALKAGDQISSEDQVSFYNAESSAALFSPSQGRFTLSPVAKSNGSGTEFIAYVKASITPARKSLATRAGGIIKNKVELAAHFGTSPYLILGTDQVRLSVEAFPMSDKAFFFVRYTYEGEAINKKLSHEGENLLLSATEIMAIDGKSVDASKCSDFKLFYYDTAAGTTAEIATFYPVFPDESKIRTELSCLVSLLKDQQKEKDFIVKEASAFLSDFYGNTRPDQLGDWMQKNAGL